MPSLTSLPVEVLAHISSFVSTQDFGALRLTCKHTENGLYRWFLDEFFTKKQFMLTPPSLQALLDISQHATFSKQLKHLIIATDVYEDRSHSYPFRDDAACNRCVPSPLNRHQSFLHGHLVTDTRL